MAGRGGEQRGAAARLAAATSGGYLAPPVRMPKRLRGALVVVAVACAVGLVSGGSPTVHDEYESYYSSSEENALGLECACKPNPACYEEGKDGAATGYKLLDKIFSGKLALTSIVCTDRAPGGAGSSKFSKIAYRLPATVRKLQSLRVLQLDLQLTGSLPDELYELRELTTLSINGPVSRTRLGGTLSPLVGRLSKLTNLSLGPALSGAVPASLGNLTQLVSLQLDGQLEGPLPVGALAGLRQLRSLRLGGRFSNVGALLEAAAGPLAGALQELSLDGGDGALPFVEVSNGAGGALALPGQREDSDGPPTTSLPVLRAALFSGNRQLSVLRLASQGVVGAVPREVGLLSGLLELDLSGNALEGALPAEVAQLSALRVLSLSDNPQLGGALPPALWALKSLQELSLGRSGLRIAQFPPGLFNMGLRKLDLDGVGLQGAIPGGLSGSALVELDLSHNNLSGLVPATGSAMARLALAHNALRGFAKPLRLAPGALVSLEGNPLVCDCTLTRWFGDLFTIKSEAGARPLHASSVLVDSEAVLCAAVNSLGGTPAALTRYSDAAPCSHPLSCALAAPPAQHAANLTFTLSRREWDAWAGVFNAGGNAGGGSSSAPTLSSSSAPSSTTKAGGRAHAARPKVSTASAVIVNSTRSPTPAPFAFALPVGQAFLDRAIAVAGAGSPLGDAAACWDCSSLTVAPEDELRNPLAFEGPASAFELQVHPEGEGAEALRAGEGREPLRMCCSASRLYAAAPDRRVNVTLRGLLPFTRYTVSARLVNVRFDLVQTPDMMGSKRSSRMSAGSWALPVALVTQSAAPGSAPQRLAASAQQDNSLTVSWDAPLVPGGEVLAYDIEYGPLDVSATSNATATALGNNQTLAVAGPAAVARLNGLAPLTRYVVRARARTAGGPGPWSEPQVLATIEPCSAGTEKREAVFPEPQGGMDCVPCGLGMYRAPEMPRCQACPDMFPHTEGNRSGSLAECLTGWGYYKDLSGAQPTARQCSQGMHCDQEGLNSETLVLEKGWWRESTRSLAVEKCSQPRFCQQTAASVAAGNRSRLLLVADNATAPAPANRSAPLADVSQAYCTVHHLGVECLACEDGYAVKSADGVCELCTDADHSHDVKAIVGWVLILLLVVLYNTICVVQVARVAYHRAQLLLQLYSSRPAPMADPEAGDASATPESTAARTPETETETWSARPDTRGPGPHVCYCTVCSGALTTDGLRTEIGGESRFFHPKCFMETLSQRALENAVVQKVVVQQQPPRKVDRTLSIDMSSLPAPATPPRPAISPRRTAVSPRRSVSIEASANKASLLSRSGKLLRFASSPEQQQQQHPSQQQHKVEPRATLRARVRRRLSAFLAGAERVASVKVRIFLGFLQVYFAFYYSFRAPALSLSQSFMNLLFLVNFDISGLLDLLAVRCTWEHNHYDSLVLYTLSPIIYALCVYAAYRFVSSCVFKACPEATSAAKTDCYTRILFAVFIVLPGASRRVFETFICDAHPTADGVLVPLDALHADPTVNCDASNRTFWIAYAACMAAVYPITIILAISALLWMVRALRWKPLSERSAAERHQVERISFLVKPYTVKAYWFEAYEMLRKVLQTTLVLFVVQATGSRQVGIFLCLALTSVSLFVLERYRPYLQLNDMRLAVVSQIVLLNACVCSLLESFSHDEPLFAGTSRTDYSQVVAASLVVEIVAFFGLAMLDAYNIAAEANANAAAKGSNEPPTPRSRSSTRSSAADSDSDDNNDEDDDSTRAPAPVRAAVEDPAVGFRQGPRPVLVTRCSTAPKTSTTSMTAV